MKLFLDANVLVSVLNREYPVYTYSARVLSLANNPTFKLYTSPLCLGIAFYYAEKKSKRTAREKIRLLSNRLCITRMDERTVKEAVNNKQVHDFVDGLQYYSAIESGCSIIVTEDNSDFYFSAIEVLDSRTFMERHVFRN